MFQKPTPDYFRGEMDQMQRGYYGYRRRSLLPRILTIVIVVIIGSAGYFACSYFSSGKKINSATEEIVHPSEEDLRALQIVSSNDIASSDHWMLIDKSNFMLYLYHGNERASDYPIALGAVSGDKKHPGDSRTPVGTFTVESIENSSYWVYDFKDGKGPIEGAYGPWFIRLKTPWEGIGIHGTHDPASIGTMCTAGCVRMRNEDLLELVEMIQVGGLVYIQE